MAAQKERMRGNTVEIRARGAAVISDAFLKEFFRLMKERGAAGYFIRGLGSGHIRHCREVLRGLGIEDQARFSTTNHFDDD
jgi:hypothetical protein